MNGRSLWRLFLFIMQISLKPQIKVLERQAWGGIGNLNKTVVKIAIDLEINANTFISWHSQGD